MFNLQIEAQKLVESTSITDTEEDIVLGRIKDLANRYSDRVNSKLLLENKRLRELLSKARPYVEEAVTFAADLTRFSPLPPEEQAKHDCTETDSEILLPKIDAALARPHPKGGKSS